MPEEIPRDSRIRDLMPTPDQVRQVCIQNEADHHLLRQLLEFSERVHEPYEFADRIRNRRKRGRNAS